MTAAAPGNIKDLLDFPIHVLQDLMRAEETGVIRKGSMQSLTAFLAKGCLLFGSYTGIGAWEHSSHLVRQAATRLGLLEEDALGPWTTVEAWDTKPSAQFVLMTMNRSHLPRHMFTDINQKVSSKAHISLMEVAPPKMLHSLSVEDKTQAFLAMEIFMQDMQAAGLLFSKTSCRRCLLHEKACQLWDVRKGEEGLPQIVFAGVTCKDVSQMNQHRLGVLGPSGSGSS